MINRSNWLLVKSYLDFLSQLQASSKTLEAEASRLRVLLTWADSSSWDSAPRIRPPFPQYALAVRHDGGEGKHAAAYVGKLVQSARRFFTWLTVHQRGYSALVPWLDTLIIPRMFKQPKPRDVVTLQYVLQLTAVEVDDLKTQRTVAAAAFLFLSGMRVDAFVSLPVAAVNVVDRSVKQWPALGVRTKFDKHATTYLLDIPDLLAVVASWHHFLIEAGASLWYPLLDPDGCLVSGEPGRFRAAALRDDLAELSDLAQVRYYAPHAFRHGHAVHSFKLAQDLGDWKAISQNLMHGSLAITDGVYGVLSDNDTKARISGLGQKVDTSAELAQLLQALLNEIKDK